jgi:hypothetical protein
MKRVYSLIALAAIASLAVSATALAANKDKGQRGQSVQRYSAALTPITTNDEDARGTARLTLRGNRLTVRIDASGLEPNETHPQHIHGFEGGQGKKRNATCPTAAQDANGDGEVSVAEGQVTYGPILLPLEPFPTANDQGEVHFERTFKVNRGQLAPLTNRHIVLHGAVADGQYWPSLPAACGQIERSGLGSVKYQVVG